MDEVSSGAAGFSCLFSTPWSPLSPFHLTEITLSCDESGVSLLLWPGDPGGLGGCVAPGCLLSGAACVHQELDRFGWQKPTQTAAQSFAWQVLEHQSDEEWLRELGASGGPSFSLKLPDRRVQPDGSQALLPGTRNRTRKG